MSSRDRSFVTAIVVLLVAVGGYFLFVAPEDHKANQLQASISSTQAALQSAEAQVQAGLRSEAQYNAYTRQIKALQTAVPSDQQIPALINELQAASDRTHVGFQAVSVSGSPSTSAAATSTAPSTAAAGATSTSAAASFPSQSFSLSFTGNYFAVANLLGTLASFVHADDRSFHVSGRLISISSVSLSPGGSGTGGAQGGPGGVTAAVTAVDYDLPGDPFATTAASTTSATPAALVTPPR